MKKNEIPNLDEQLAHLSSVKDEDIDYSDIPQITDWSCAMTREEFDAFRKSQQLQIDADILLWFRNRSPEYTTEINAVLRNYMLSHV